MEFVKLGGYLSINEIEWRLLAFGLNAIIVLKCKKNEKNEKRLKKN